MSCNESVQIVFFDRPHVDLDAFQDYTEAVSHPMDLGTMRARLRPGLSAGWGTIAHYKSTDDVLRDARRVFANCRQYNEPGSAIWCAFC